MSRNTFAALAFYNIVTPAEVRGDACLAKAQQALSHPRNAPVRWKKHGKIANKEKLIIQMSRKR